MQRIETVMYLSFLCIRQLADCKPMCDRYSDSPEKWREKEMSGGVVTGPATWVWPFGAKILQLCSNLDGLIKVLTTKLSSSSSPTDDLSFRALPRVVGRLDEIALQIDCLSGVERTMVRRALQIVDEYIPTDGNDRLRLRTGRSAAIGACVEMLGEVSHQSEVTFKNFVVILDNLLEMLPAAERE